MIPLRVLLAIALTAFAAVSAAQPRVTIEQGQLSARLGGSAIDGTELRSKLQSGLSTTFVITVRGDVSPPAQRIAAAARVEVRYDLWDEVFILTLRRADGTATRETVKSMATLAAWWNERAIALAPAGGATQFEGELELRILPFSFNEERDAQGWLSRSLGLSSKGSTQPAGSGAPDARPASEAPSQGGMLDALIATSIRAKPISVRRWRVTTGAR